MRKFIVAVVILLVLIVIGLLAAPYFLDVNRYHDQIQAQLEKRLGRAVSLGRMQLALLPPAFRVENAVIGEDPSLHSKRPFADASQLYVTAALWPLLQGNVEIHSLELRQPHIELVRSAEGKWNFSTLGQSPGGGTSSSKEPGPASAGPATSTPPPGGEKPREFSLSSLKITDGQVAVTDLLKHQERAIYDHIDLEVDGFQPGKPFDFDLAAHLPGAGAELVEVKGNAGPIATGDTLQTPFRGSYKLDEVSLAGVQKFLNSPALAEVGGIASGSGDLSNQGGALAASGTFKLENGRFKGHDIGYPITADYALTDDLTVDLLKIQKGALKLGSTPVDIAGTVNAKPTPAELDLTIKTGDVSISEAARLASVFGVAFNPTMKIDGQMRADLRAQGAASNPALNGTLTGRELAISGGGIARPVQIKSVDLALSPEEIRSTPFDASTGGTTVGMQFALSRYTTPEAAVDATVKTSGASVGDVLDIAKAYGISAVEGMSGSGALNLDLHLTGPLKGVQPFTYSGTGLLENASLNLPSLTKPLQVRHADLRFSSDSAVLQNVSASLGQTSATGALTLRNFNAPQVQFTLSADKMSVAEWQQMMRAEPATRAASAWTLVPAAEAQPGAQPGIIQKMTGTGTLSVGTILYDQLVLTNARSNVTLDHGLIRLAPLTAELYGGQESGQVLIDTRPATMTYSVDMKLNNVDANKLLSSVSSVKTLYGLLATNASTHFTAPANASSADIARSLNGNASLDLVKGRLMNVDILQQLSSIGQFGNFGHTAQNFTNITKLTGNFNVVNGVATTNDLKAIIDGGSLAATGSANLADQTLNMRLTAVLNKQLSQQVGGTTIGGFMNTALANQNGELVIPIRATGTFASPRFAPDLEKMAQMKLQNMLPTLNNPGQMTSGILGAILGSKGQGQGGQGQQGGLGGILGGILGQGQQQRGQPAQGQQPQAQQQQQQQQQQPQDIFSQILGAVNNQQKKQQQQKQQQQQQQQQQQSQPDQPPR